MVKYLFFLINIVSVVLAFSSPDFNTFKVSNNITFYQDDSIKSLYYVFPYSLALDSIKKQPNLYVNSFFQTTENNSIFNKNEIGITLKKVKLNNNVINQAFSKIKIIGSENYKFLSPDKLSVQLFIPDLRNAITDTLDLFSEEEMIKQINIDDKLVLYKSLTYEEVSLMRETIFKHNTPLKISYFFQTINCASIQSETTSKNNSCIPKSNLIPFLVTQSDSDKVFIQKHIKLAPTPIHTGITISNFDFCNGTDMLDSTFNNKIEAIQSKKIIITAESSGKKKVFAQAVFNKGDLDCNRYLKFKTVVFINKPISYTIIKVLENGNTETSEPIFLNNWNQIDISENLDN